MLLKRRSDTPCVILGGEEPDPPRSWDMSGDYVGDQQACAEESGVVRLFSVSLTPLTGSCPSIAPLRSAEVDA